MPPLTLVVGADNKEAVRAIEELQKQLVKLQGQVATNNAGHRETVDISERLVGTIGKMAAGYLTIDTAIGAIKDATAAWGDRMKQIAGDSDKFRQNILGSLAEQGRLPQADAVMKRLQSMGATRGEASEAYAGATSAPLPPGVSLEQGASIQEQIARLAVDQAPAGIKIGDYAHQISELYRIMPSRSPDELARMNQYALEHTRGRMKLVGDRRFLNAVQTAADAGLDAETAYGAAITALAKAQRPDEFEKSLTGQKARLINGQVVTGGPSGGPKREEIERTVSELREAAKNYQLPSEQLPSTVAGRRAISDDLAQARREQIDFPLDRESQRRKRLDREIEEGERWREQQHNGVGYLFEWGLNKVTPWSIARRQLEARIEGATREVEAGRMPSDNWMYRDFPGWAINEMQTRAAEDHNTKLLEKLDKIAMHSEAIEQNQRTGNIDPNRHVEY